MRSEERPESGASIDAEARLLQQLRDGDADAGHRLVRDYYPGVYQYLLYLTRCPESAEDLAQETFLRAWRGITTFEGRAPLRLWLHRIAHREFLRALRSRQAQISLEEVPELPEPHAADSYLSMVLREAIRRLPLDEREIVVLHYLHGYNCQEIAQIVRAPDGTVKYRLSTARSRLQQALGEGDLAYLNEQPAVQRSWAWLPLDQMYALETRLVPGPGAAMEETMERREFLRCAAVGAAGLMLPEAEKEVVDPRLTQKVTRAYKAIALSDLCDHLQAQTGVQVTAGPSVADEKVTLFCNKEMLRDVMRQLSRPFGYTWLRSGKEKEYRYELVQDLRSQLLEEELRNRDRHAALLALEAEIEQFRPYLHLSPDEALVKSQTASGDQKRLLEQLAGVGWGPIQMYFRLSPQDQAALRAGERLRFSERPREGERPLPPDLGRGSLQTLRESRFIRTGGMFESGDLKSAPHGLPLTAIPEAKGSVYLTMGQGELGQFTLSGGSGFALWIDDQVPNSGSVSREPYAVGESPTVRRPRNAILNARRSREQDLQSRINVQPQRNPSPSPSPTRRGKSAGNEDKPLTSLPTMLPSPRSQGTEEGVPISMPTPRPSPPSPRRGGAGGGVPKFTSADVLEALHQATGMPIVADFYTRLYPSEAVSVQDEPLFESLNRLADAMRLRWSKDGDWLQLRSASFYHDRLKEVPHRLMARWHAARQQRGHLTLDDLIEIARLTDAQLDADSMAEGARECFDLAEWDLARSGNLRPHLRFLGELTPAQRQKMTSAGGLAFAEMTLSQQQRYIALGPDDLAHRVKSLEELADATVRVDYTQPDWYQWGAPVDRLGRPRPVLGPWPVRERTRGAALQAARRLDPHVTEDQLVRTRLDLRIIYLWSSHNQRTLRLLDAGGGTCLSPWD